SSSSLTSPARASREASPVSTGVASASGSAARGSLASSVITKAPPSASRPQQATRGRQLWGLVAGVQGTAEQFRRDVDDRDDPLVGHARRSDHAEDPDGVVLGRIRGRDDATLLEDLVARFLADEDLHAVGVQALV